MACASTVAVVVPSPAMSEGLEATSFTIWAPMFASLSSSSISLATVTPSLVTVGAPQLFSMMTLRPRGPRVTFTVSASMFKPRAMRCRADCANTTSLAAIWWFPSIDQRKDLVLAQNQVLDAVDLDLAARILGEEDLVPGLDVELAKAAVFLQLAAADGHDQRLDGLLLGGIGDVQSPGGLVLFHEALHQDTVVEGSELHGLLMAPAAQLDHEELRCR